MLNLGAGLHVLSLLLPAGERMHGVLFVFKTFIVPCGKFGSPYPGKAQ